MSNNNSPSKNKDQAGSSSQNNPIDVHCIDNIDFDNLTTEKALEIADSIINGFKSQFPTPQSVADVLLGWEAAGFPPKKMEKNVLKAELLHIEFQTTEWKEWVSERRIDFSNCGQLY